MTPANRLELAEEARANVASAIAWLEQGTVEALDRSALEFSAATERIQRLKEDLSGGGSTLKAILGGLRKDLRQAGTLLRHGWEFRAGLAGQVGYTRTGELVAQPPSTGRWTMEG